MRELRSEVEISASPELVWQWLTDLESYSQWNPFIRRANGILVPGQRLEVYLKPSSGTGMTFRPTVLKVEPNRELRWLGHLIVPGLFDGEHIFVIESLGPNLVRFIQRERFTGALASLLLLWIGRDTQRGFEEMNDALKVCAEQDSALRKAASS